MRGMAVTCTLPATIAFLFLLVGLVAANTQFASLVTETFAQLNMRSLATTGGNTTNDGNATTTATTTTTTATTATDDDSAWDMDACPTELGVCNDDAKCAFCIDLFEFTEECQPSKVGCLEAEEWLCCSIIENAEGCQDSNKFRDYIECVTVNTLQATYELECDIDIDVADCSGVTGLPQSYGLAAVGVTSLLIAATGLVM